MVVPSDLNGNADLGDIDSDEAAAIFPSEDAAGFDGFPAPAIKAKDPIGFRDRVPAFDIGELAAIGLARADLPAVEIAPQRLYLFC